MIDVYYAISTLFSFIFFCLFSYGQKPVVTLETYKNWQRALEGDLSADGNFALYIATDTPRSKNTVFIKKTTGEIVTSIVEMSKPKFTQNSKYVVGQLAGDSLLVYELRSGIRKYITGVLSYELTRWNGKERLILKGPNRQLQIIDYNGTKLLYLASVSDYIISDNSSTMIVFEDDSLLNQGIVKWVDAHSARTNVIYRGNSFSNVIFDKEANQIAFLENTDKGNVIVYYRKKNRSAEKLEIKEGNRTVIKGEYWCFSNDGSRIFFSFGEPDISKIKANSLNLEISSYQDIYLHSYYNGQDFPKERMPAKNYLATINIDTKQVLELTSEDQKVVETTLKPETDRYCIIESMKKSADGITHSYFLCDIKTGELLKMETDSPVPIYGWNISPGTSYVVYYDVGKKNYICYDIKAQVKRNITRSVNGSLINYKKLHYPNPYKDPVGIMGWLQNDKTILIYGTYDIWGIDPKSEAKPVNLTKGIGDKSKVIFSLAGSNSGGLLGKDGKILLTAFDTRSKDFGFYSLGVGSGGQLTRLYMGRRYIVEPYTPLPSYCLKSSPRGFLLWWQQADCSPNYYFTPDWKTFVTISDVKPELKWNWLKTELHTYKDSLGNELQGVLYKPENFDSTKKYPIIFNVYEFRSDLLNAFPSPALRAAEFVLPVMVSNDYLIFMPDIRSVPKFGGDGAVRSIAAAVNHLSKFNWIDTTKMGLIGHSVGGFVTNYTVTHYNKFKAAVSGAGISDMVRAATDLWENGNAKQEFLKDAVYMMQTDLTDDPQAYVRNSAIFAAKNLRTPLLLFHNDQDGSVNYNQSRSFFIVLRGLHKPCWWLNYKGENHGVLGTEKKKDYNTKVWQFFDHYLKGAPMPDWMKEHL